MSIWKFPQQTKKNAKYIQRKWFELFSCLFLLVLHSFAVLRTMGDQTQLLEGELHARRIYTNKKKLIFKLSLGIKASCVYLNISFSFVAGELNSRQMKKRSKNATSFFLLWCALKICEMQSRKLPAKLKLRICGLLLFLFVFHFLVLLFFLSLLIMQI